MFQESVDHSKVMVIVHIQPNLKDASGGDILVAEYKPQGYFLEVSKLSLVLHFDRPIAPHQMWGRGKT